MMSAMVMAGATIGVATAQDGADLASLSGRLEALGATVALTADHGMNEKTNEDGTPRVVWLQDVLDAACGAGTSTVICPITDAFVGHHGALGGFVRSLKTE